jgi:hypothetical protein
VDPRKRALAVLASTAMEPVTWVFAVVAAVVVFVMAAVVIGREARRLDAVAPRVVYNIDEAVEFVGDRVPAATQARLTPGELEQLLVFHLRWLHAKGLQPVDVVDRRQDIDTPTVIDEDTVVGFVLGEAEREGVEVLDDVDVVAVVDAHLAYFDAIGAVGPQAAGDDITDLDQG